MKNDILCIIPAKGGSTRFPRKNIYPLAGKPLIAYAIEAAIHSDLFTDIVVSTEDEEIKEVAERYHAEVPYLRPDNLAKDPAGVVEVCLDMISYLEDQGRFYQTLVILLPTSPLRSVEDIKEAFECYVKSPTNFLMSVSEYDHSPFSALNINQDGLLTPYFNEYVKLKSQELPPAYRANGAITIVNIDAFKQEKAYYAYPLQAYKMPIERSIDIDHMSDLLYAEFLLKKKSNNEDL